MTKFRPEKRRYFQTGISGYIGSGNNLQVFTRRSKPSFAKLRQIYGDHLEDFMANNPTHKEEKKISNELREKIKSDIQKEYKKFIRNQIIAITLSVIIMTVIILLTWKIIGYFYPNLM